MAARVSSGLRMTFPHSLILLSLRKHRNSLGFKNSDHDFALKECGFQPHRKPRKFNAALAAEAGLRTRQPHFGQLVTITALLFASLFSGSLLFASNLTDTARQFADRIAAITGPGAITLDLTNRASLGEKSVTEIRTALKGQLHDRGIRTASVDQSMGTVSVVLSENLREYVWTAQIAIGTDQPRVVLISLPRPPSSIPLGSSLPLKLEKTFLFSQPRPILDAVVIDAGEGLTQTTGSGNARLLILDADHVAIYHQLPGHSGEPSGLNLPATAAWELESSLPVPHIRTFPRDLRGRLILRRDHLFDVYLPGVFCRSSATVPLRLDCNASDDPWPLSADETGPNAIRAFYASARNFFTGALSPSIGRVSTLPSFYSAAPVPRSGYTLWVLTAVDGSVHLIDGVTDQVVQTAYVGSEIASVMSSCVRHPQILITDASDSNNSHDHDILRAIEILDRDPVAISPPLEFGGLITALWPDASRHGVVAIMHREDTGQYEAYRISTTCAD